MTRGFLCFAGRVPWHRPAESTKNRNAAHPRRKKTTGGLRPPYENYENRAAKTAPGGVCFYVWRRVTPERWQGK
jgi:hypothetical protein